MFFFTSSTSTDSSSDTIVISFLYPKMVVCFWWKIERCITLLYISTLGKVIAISKLDMPLFDSVYGT